MKKLKEYFYQDIGIILCIIFFICFVITVDIVRPYLDGTRWYLFSSAQRTIFGLIELFIFIKVFHKKGWKDVIHFKHFKSAILAGTGVVLYTALNAAFLCLGVVSLKNITFALLFSRLICQQLTTGFWEELTFRAFVLEGYFKKKNRNWLCRLVYAVISFMLFGLPHAIEYNDFGKAMYRLMITGAFGFIYAAIYMYSHNIFAPMLLHFIYDIPANFYSFVDSWDTESNLIIVLDNYGFTVAFILMMIISFIFVIKKPVYENTSKTLSDNGRSEVCAIQ